ncbi:hypothetical protein [Ruminococcus sp.]
MNKRLLGLTSSAFILTAAFTGCTVKSENSSFTFSVSDDDTNTAETTEAFSEADVKNKAKFSKSDLNPVSARKAAEGKAKKETTTEAPTTTEKPTEAKTEPKKNSKSESVGSGEFRDIAGTYHRSGHMYFGDVPDEFSADNVKASFEKEPMTISEDGILHFCGKDYQLIAEGKKDDDTIYSIAGSGFDMNEFCSSSDCSSTDYEGPCFFALDIQHMTVNDVDYPYEQYCVYLTKSGSKSYYGCVYVDEGEASKTTSWFDDWD